MNVEENSPHNGSKSSGGFGLPANYFERSAENLRQRFAWEEELMEFPRLAKLRERSVFAVPENYFESVANRLELLDYPLLNSFSRNLPFGVPAGYFESLDNQIASAEQTLRGLSRAVPFEVPASYFDQSANQLRAKLAQPEARIVPLWRRVSAYAAAAVLLLSMGWWINDHYFTPERIEDCGTIACVDRNELLQSHALEGLDDADLYEIINSHKLENTLTKKIKDPAGSDSSSSPDLDDLPDDL